MIAFDSVAFSQRGTVPEAVLCNYYNHIARTMWFYMSLASMLFSMQLLSQEERDQVITPESVSSLWRTMTLLGAVEARAAAEESTKPLIAFCQELKKIPKMSMLAESMKNELGGH